MALVAALVFAGGASAGVIFNADFNASTAVSGSVTANATVANLNAGTSVGDWSNTSGGNPPTGAIIDNSTSGDGSDNAFAFDNSTAGGQFISTANFSEDLEIGNGATIEFDIYAARQGGGRDIVFQFRNASNNISYNFRFELDNSKHFEFVETGGAATRLATAPDGDTGSDFDNPGVGDYMDGWTPIHVKIDLLGINASTVLDDESGRLSVDWEGDGNFTGPNDVLNVAFSPRNAGISEITKIRLGYAGSGNRGIWLDNLVVTEVPEPASLALMGLGGLMMMRRRTA